MKSDGELCIADFVYKVVRVQTMPRAKRLFTSLSCSVDSQSTSSCKYSGVSRGCSDGVPAVRLTGPRTFVRHKDLRYIALTQVYPYGEGQVTPKTPRNQRTLQDRGRCNRTRPPRLLRSTAAPKRKLFSFSKHRARGMTASHSRNLQDLPSGAFFLAGGRAIDGEGLPALRVRHVLGAVNFLTGDLALTA
jgi:hypothetical protein